MSHKPAQSFQEFLDMMVDVYGTKPPTTPLSASFTVTLTLDTVSKIADRTVELEETIAKLKADNELLRMRSEWTCADPNDDKTLPNPTASLEVTIYYFDGEYFGEPRLMNGKKLRERVFSFGNSDRKYFYRLYEQPTLPQDD